MKEPKELVEEARKDQTVPHIERQGSASLAVHPVQNDMRFMSAVIDVTSLQEIHDVRILESTLRDTRIKMARLEKLALEQNAAGSPRTDLLLNLISLNFTRALMENTKVLGLTSEQLHDDAISPFNTAGPWQNDSLDNLPVGLQPTMIQRRIPHHPWLDLLPIAQLRDNLILAGEFEGESQLCLDMKGSGNTGSQRSGIIVWNDPWDPFGWEVTEPFVQSWTWVVRDCYGLALSTNRWRLKRGEKPLFRLP